MACRLRSVILTDVCHGRSAANELTEARRIIAEARLRPPSHGAVRERRAYAKRTARGQLKEMDEKGRRLESDRPVKAKRSGR